MNTTEGRRRLDEQPTPPPVLGADGESRRLALQQIMLDNSLDGIVAHTPDGELLYANEAAMQQWQMSAEEARRRGPFGWVAEEQRPSIADRTATLMSGAAARFETTGRRPDGSFCRVEVQARCIETPDGPVILSTARDISERREAEEMVRYLAYHDMLTGLANRVLLGQDIAHAIAEAERHGDVIGVLFIDLDRFKPINDSYGHAVGDHVLREIADRIAGCVRETDTVARLGGDEFVVLLPRLATAAALVGVAQKVTEEIERKVTINSIEVCVQATMGLAAYRTGEDADSLLTRADLSMYEAREAGVRGWDMFAA